MPTKSTSKQAAKPAPLSLVQFMRNKKKEHCAVCKLPAEVRAQLKEAPDKGIRVSDRLAWLFKLGHSVTAPDLTAHMNGRHDDE